MKWSIYQYVDAVNVLSYKTKLLASGNNSTISLSVVVLGTSLKTTL